MPQIWNNFTLVYANRTLLFEYMMTKNPPLVYVLILLTKKLLGPLNSFSLPNYDWLSVAVHWKYQKRKTTYDIETERIGNTDYFAWRTNDMLFKRITIMQRFKIPNRKRLQRSEYVWLVCLLKQIHYQFQ